MVVSKFKSATKIFKKRNNNFTVQRSIKIELVIGLIVNSAFKRNSFTTHRRYIHMYVPSIYSAVF